MPFPGTQSPGADMDNALLILNAGSSSLKFAVYQADVAGRLAGAHVKEKLRDMQIECRNYAYENGVDLPAADAWVWPY
jgi:acetate kinase